MNSIFLIIFDLNNDLFISCTSYTSCTIFFKKNHLHLFALEAKKIDAELGKKFNHGSKKHESPEKEGGSIGNE